MVEFNRAEEVVQYLEERLKSIGIVLVDSSVHEGNRADRQFIVVVGILPERACIFTVFGGFRAGSCTNNYEFRITGQLDKEGLLSGKRLLSDEKWIRGYSWFPDINRNPMGYEIFAPGSGYFMVNHHVYPANSDSESIEKGIAFYQGFLSKHASSLARSFSESISLWFVPKYSAEFLWLEAENGVGNHENVAHFNARVMAKFPPGLLAENQKP